MNKTLTEIFEKLSKYYDKDHENNPYLEKSFLDASEILSKKSIKVKLTSSGQLDEKIRTKMMFDMVNEYLDTGNVAKLQQLQEKYDDEVIIYENNPIFYGLTDIKNEQLVKYFESFYGIGTTTAVDLVNKGYTTLSQVWDNKDKLLTNIQQKGIFWRNHLSQRIPRDEMDEIYLLMNNLLTPYKIEWDLVGSYRRETIDSGDIDLLIKKNDKFDVPEKIVEVLNEHIVEVFTNGKKKSSGMFQLSDDYYAHRIDILVIPDDSWFTALLYFTGSDTFNKLIRQHAQSLGYKLNEYSLTKISSEQKIKIFSENTIFTELGLKYLSPKQRTNDLENLEPL